MKKKHESIKDDSYSPLRSGRSKKGVLDMMAEGKPKEKAKRKRAHGKK